MTVAILLYSIPSGWRLRTQVLLRGTRANRRMADLLLSILQALKPAWCYHREKCRRFIIIGPGLTLCVWMRHPRMGGRRGNEGLAKIATCLVAVMQCALRPEVLGEAATLKPIHGEAQKSWVFPIWKRDDISQTLISARHCFGSSKFVVVITFVCSVNYIVQSSLKLKFASGSDISFNIICTRLSLSVDGQ